MVYTVVEGDTLIGIAVRFGVTLEEMLSANPGVDPRLLTIGTPLLIPLGEDGAGVANLPTPTPLPLSEEGIFCYANAAGGLWCFWQVQNQREEAVENVSALVSLYDEEGQQTASGVALAPLNLLRPDERMPLVIYFAPPVPDWAGVYGDILTSIPLPEDSERYLDTVINDLSVAVDEGGLQAQVQGRITLEDRQQEAGLVWVAAVAYDAQNRVVGLRRWESEEGIEAGETQSFELWVYSLGPAIQRVEVFAEVRP
jgi:LysM repeat protein